MFISSYLASRLRPTDEKRLTGVFLAVPFSYAYLFLITRFEIAIEGAERQG